MASTSDDIRSEAKSRRKATKIKASPSKSRRRPPATEGIHDDANRRLALDNDSQHIAIDLHGIDLSQDATEWRRFSKMDAPDPLPGYRQRWVRVRLAGKGDDSNVYRKIREGWRPRPLTSVVDGHLLPTIQLGQFGHCIGVEDSILMQRPIAVANQERDYYQNKRRQQTASTDHALDTLSEAHNVPLLKRNRTRVGRTPRVAADD